jgi:hypothetical protein
LRNQLLADLGNDTVFTTVCHVTADCGDTWIFLVALRQSIEPIWTRDAIIVREGNNLSGGKTNHRIPSGTKTAVLFMTYICE